MDDIVRQAMAKWPNVPHCYGWLVLDARGSWRMRDEQAQASGGAGDKIVHAALLGFINRNYTHDPRGCWYFQNGPQRVYVDLEAAPYIAHTDPQAGFADQASMVLPAPDQAWLTETGQLLLRFGEKIAWLDDRDIAQCMADVRIDGAAMSEELLMAWLEGRTDTGRLTLCIAGRLLTAQRILAGTVAAHFGFVPRPRPEAE